MLYLGSTIPSYVKETGLTLTEYTTALFIAGCYFWWMDDQLGVQVCERTLTQLREVYMGDEE